jgi:GTP-dependent phosphoenolpyruvate carboxykinase
MHELLHVDRTTWVNEVIEQQTLFDQFGDRLPQELIRERNDLAARLSQTVD